MKVFSTVVVVWMAAIAVGVAGLIEYDSNTESGNQWIYGPDSGGAYGSGLDTYVGPGGDHPGSVTFFDASDDSPLGSATWSGAGWLQGGLSQSTDVSIYGVVTITGGAYLGYYYTLNTSPTFTFPEGNESHTYVTGGTDPVGPGSWVVPEPTTWALFGVGLIVLAGRKLRRR